MVDGVNNGQQAMDGNVQRKLSTDSSQTTTSSLFSNNSSARPSPSAFTRGGKHHLDFFNSLATLYEDGSMTDVTIQVHDQIIYKAHRVVLAASSPFFKALFTSEVGEANNCNNVTLSAVDAQAFKVILDYMYSRRLELTVGNVTEVLRDSCYLLMQDVEVLCCLYIARLLKPSNCFEYLQLASAYSSSHLADTCIQFICRQGFSVITKAQEFSKIEQRQLYAILSKSLNDNITEDALINVVMHWITENKLHQRPPSEGKNSLLNLFKLLHLSAAQPDTLSAVLANESLMKKNAAVRKLFEDALRKTSREDKDEATPANPRAGVLYSNHAQNHLSMFDSEVRKWTKVAPAPYNMDLTCVTLFALDESDLGIVGSDVRVDSIRADDLGLGSHVAVFNQNSKAWHALPSLNVVRCRPAVVSVPYVDMIMVAGGLNEPNDPIFCRHLDSCEVLSHHRSKWRLVAEMDGHGGDGLRLVTAQDRIFAVGGANCRPNASGASLYSNKLSFMVISDLLNEDYEPQIDVPWSNSSPMTLNRSHHGAAVLGPALYAVGGVSDRGPTASVERFDFERCEWFESPALPRPAPCIAATASGGLLTCLMSFSSDIQDQGLAPYDMLTFDPRDGLWHDENYYIPTPCHIGITHPGLISLAS